MASFWGIGYARSAMFRMLWDKQYKESPPPQSAKSGEQFSIFGEIWETNLNDKSICFAIQVPSGS